MTDLEFELMIANETIREAGSKSSYRWDGIYLAEYTLDINEGMGGRELPRGLFFDMDDDLKSIWKMTGYS